MTMPDKPASSVTQWSWLFPLTYVIHIAEEFYGGEGYPAYLKRLRGVEMSPAKFLVGQAIGLALIALGIVTLLRFKSSVRAARYWLYVAIGIGINVVIALITLQG